MSEEERKMNDTTMPPPRAKNSKKTSVATGRVARAAAAPPRRKQGRFGLSEWNRLLRTSKDLAQLKGQPLRRIPMSEIRQHDSLYDGWIALRGKVYRLSPYFPYHPGGESILKKVLGRDATSLFDKYHRWVNVDGCVFSCDTKLLFLTANLTRSPLLYSFSLIGKLLIGYVDTSSGKRDEKSSSYLPQMMTSDGFAIPAPKPPKAVAAPKLLPTKKEEEEEDVVALWEKREKYE